MHLRLTPLEHDDSTAGTAAPAPAAWPFTTGWTSLGAGPAIAEPLCGKARDGTDDEAEDDEDDDFEGFDDDEEDDEGDDEDEFDDEEDDLSGDDEDGDGEGDEEDDEEEDEPL